MNVSEPGGQKFKLRECPTDIVIAPVNRVTALMNEPDLVAAAVQHLVRAGIPSEQIFILCGPKGAQRFDVSGRHQGLRGRLHRFAALLGDEYDELKSTEEHIAAGGISISVPANDNQKSMVAEVLGRHGGFDIIHHGAFHWERLGGGDEHPSA